MHEERANIYQFIRDWALNSVLVWPGVLCMWVMLWIPFGFVLAFFDNIALLEVLSWLQLVLIPGTIAGVVLGDMQQSLMKQHLNWSSPRWSRVSLAGGFAGGMLVMAAHQFTVQPNSPDELLIVLMPLFLGCLSLAQWLELRHMTPNAWLWVLGNITAGIIFSSLVFINRPMIDNPLLIILWYALALVAQGVVTGYVMVWLYEHRDDDTDRGRRARVYVEIRNDHPDHRR